MESINSAQVFQFFIFAGGIIGIYVRMQTKLKELDIRLLSLESKIAHVERQDEKIMDKLDSISEQINEIKIQLQNKQDRI